jgi:hypothetical protein
MLILFLSRRFVNVMGGTAFANTILPTAFRKMAFNVPAVYDVLPARIRACVARPGLAKCAGATAWEWSVAQ